MSIFRTFFLAACFVLCIVSLFKRKWFPAAVYLVGFMVALP